MQINLAVFLAVFFLFEYGKYIYVKAYGAVFDPLRAFISSPLRGPIVSAGKPSVFGSTYENI